MQKKYYQNKPPGRAVMYGLVIALVALALWLIFAPAGIIKYMRINKELELVQQENDELRKKNETLADEIGRLKNDPAYIEKTARERYGMIKKNEIIFDFEEKKKGHK